MMQQETAEKYALTALAWLVAEDDLLPVFMGATGADEADLRARAGEAEFLASVLDFLMMDDAWVMRFCDAAGLPYEIPMQARQAFPGGGDVSWT